MAAVKKALDRDHYGLDKVKERILEFVAVKQLAPELKGQVLCLVGPPGVGKTSIAMSMAKAMNRKLARISLGGVSDEAEIRGHRKTYVGAMPGRIINAVSQAGSCNPLILLDEIDKLGHDHRGDPASALLEVLDGEQNATFRDHFLEVPFDLSDVLFITTANTLDTIPRPLLDRMEVIELPSYTDEEKLQIAKHHLLPKELKRHGLTHAQVKVSDGAVREIVAAYTRESGVRVLERKLAAICRKAAMKIVDGEKTVKITEKDLHEYLGAPRYFPERQALEERVGVVNGLAWTSVGGELLEVEVNVVPGSGKVELTGNLGDVMKESAHAALSFIRSQAERLGISQNFYKEKDIHVHFPEGAVPKDGPSAGIAITTAIVSALTGVPVRRGLAMTGEVTLRGRVLPIGGLKEKTMAAFRNGIRTVIIPADNEKDLEEIDQTVRPAVPSGGAGRPGAGHRPACPERRGEGEHAQGGAGDHAAPGAGECGRPPAPVRRSYGCQFTKNGVYPLRRLPQGLSAGRTAPGRLCRAVQRGQVVGDQPAAEPEELRPGGGRPRQDHPHQLFQDRRDLLPGGPARLWLCQGVQKRTGPVGQADGDLFRPPGADDSGRDDRGCPAQAHGGRLHHGPVV